MELTGECLVLIWSFDESQSALAPRMEYELCHMEFLRACQNFDVGFIQSAYQYRGRGAIGDKTKVEVVRESHFFCVADDSDEDWTTR